MSKRFVKQALVCSVVGVPACVLVSTGCAPPETVTVPPGRTIPQARPPDAVIEDLAYIKIFVSSYSDDANPQDDGIALDIDFYDSKNELVTFRDIPVTVIIELYGYRDVRDTFDHERMEFIYQAQVTVDHSMRLSEMFGKYIRIPFENILVDRNKYCEFGTVEVTVTTPKQGDFQDMQDLIRIYPEE